MLRPRLESAGDLLEFERLYHIPGIEVLKMLQAHTAVIPRRHLPHVILQAPETGRSAVPL